LHSDLNQHDVSIPPRYLYQPAAVNPLACPPDLQTLDLPSGNQPSCC
jgi:hypothetical protein